MSENRTRAVARTALLLLGMALYWNLLRYPSIDLIMLGHGAAGLPEAPWLAATLLVTLVVCALIPFARRHWAGLLFSPSTATVAAGTLLACKALLMLPAIPAWLAFPAMAISSVAFAYALAMLTCLWAARFVDMPSVGSATAAVVSFVLSFIMYRLVRAAGGSFGPLLFAAIPFASALSVFALSRGEKPLSADASTLPSEPLSPGLQRRVPAVRLSIIVALLLAGSIARRLVVPDGFPGADGLVASQDIAASAFALCILALYHRITETERRFQILWSAGAIVLFAGLLIVASTGQGLLGLGRSLLIVARACLVLIFWVMLTDVCRQYGVSPIDIFGSLFLGVEVISLLIAYVLLPSAATAVGLNLQNLGPYISAALVFLLIVTLAVCLLWVGMGTADADDASTGPKQNIDISQLQTWQAGAFERWDLSPRETQVACLLAEGNSQRAIAERLGLSIGSVQTHIKGVYRKSGVHSKQEFIDLVRGM